MLPSDILVIDYAPVTLITLGLMVMVSLYAYFVDPSWFEWFIFQPATLRSTHRYHTLLSSGFLHGDFVHLGINCLVWYSFGTLMEKSAGSGPFLLYVVSTLFAGNLVLFLLYNREPRFFSLGMGSLIIGAIIYRIILFPALPLQFVFLPFQLPFLALPLFYLGFLYYAIFARLDNINHQSTVMGALAGLIFLVARFPEWVDGFVKKVFGG